MKYTHSAFKIKSRTDGENSVESNMSIKITHNICGGNIFLIYLFFSHLARPIWNIEGKNKYLKQNILG